jgi:ATPase subunit of ABC transporter with duplicated ATPase domains
MAAKLVAHGLSLELPDGRGLFSDLDLSLDDGLTALVGPNGVGKTCLARVLAGELEPTAGVVRRHVPVRLLAQRQEPPCCTVAEFLTSDHHRSSFAGQLVQDIEPSSSCAALSGGQWMRVRLAQALGAAFLILDEPTNDLDGEGHAAVAAFLRHHDGGALVISHDPRILRSCARVLELSNHGLAAYSGGWSAYTEARDEERVRLGAALDRARRGRDAARERQAEQQERLQKRSARGAAAARRGGMPAILMGARKRRAEVTAGRLGVQQLARAQEAVRVAHEALGRLKVEPVMYARLKGRAIPHQRLVAEARGFNVCFQDWIYGRDLDFSWRGNVRVALKGGNGSGKTTLVRALLGESLRTRGELRRGSLCALYVDQRCSLLDDERSLLDNVQQAAPGPVAGARTALAAFLFQEDKVFQKVGELSGGERLRAALACGLLGSQGPELLVLDEPTNNLDLQNVEFLQQVVSAFQGALVVISHDEDFLRQLQLTQELQLDAP